MEKVLYFITILLIISFCMIPISGIATIWLDTGFSAKVFYSSVTLTLFFLVAGLTIHAIIEGK